MAIAEITLVPIGTEKASISSYVAGALDAVHNFPSLKYELNPMGTVLEGDLDDIFACVKAMRETVFEAGSERCYVIIKLDERRDKQASMNQKLASVAAKRKYK